MDVTVIVALPAVDDRVQKISSEKVPHLTLLYLPRISDGDDLQHVMEFVQHAAEDLNPVYLNVEYRDTLGDEDADVLFFDTNAHWGMREMAAFRNNLLLNDTIQRLHASIDQFPEWIPHLTLGYPGSPAKERPEDADRRIYDVRFDRIAVWTEAYEGPEFRLKDQDLSVSDMAMSSLAEQGAEFLTHYGVKGMRWGVKKADDAQAKIEKAQAKGDNKTVAKQTAKRDKALDDADSKWQKSIYTNGGAVKVHNAMAEHFNKKIDALNDQHPDADLFDKPDSPASKAYMDALTALENESYSAAIKSVHGTSPSRKKEAVYVSDENGQRIEVRDAEVKHAEAEDTAPDLVVLLKMDASGHVIEANQASLELEHGDTAQEFLAHYGVKGMRWGVRKDEATSRGGADSGPTAVVVTQKKPGKFAKTEGGKNHEIHKDSVDALKARQKAKASTTDALSNAELRTAVERMQLERRYAELEFSNDRRSRGSRFIAGLLGVKKKTKFSDLDEDAGEKVRAAIKEALAAQAKNAA